MQSAQIHVVTAGHDINDPAFAGFAFQLHAFAAQVIDTAALFFLRRISCVEYNSVPALKRSMNTADYAIPQNLLDSAHIHAAAFWKGSVHQLFVIRSFQEAVRKAARKALLQLTHIFLGGRRPVPVKITVNRFAVFTDHVRHVFRSLEPAFDFE
ncbi:hypothetical protein D3C75_652690 [compost metagenome]